MAGTNNQGRGSVNSNNNKQTRGNSSTGRTNSTSKASTGNAANKTPAGSVNDKTAMSGSRTNSEKKQSNPGGRGTASGYDDSYTMQRKEAARKQLQEAEDSRKNEIVLFIYLAIAIFLFVSNFGLCGFIGNLISGFIFGMLGTVSYIIPIYLFLAAAFFLVNGAHKTVVRRVACVTLFIIAFAFVCQLISGTGDVGVKTLYMEGAKNKSGGGVLLGGILVLLNKLVGLPGSIIVIILLFIIGIIIVMDVSLVELLKGHVAQRREENDASEYDTSYKYRENPNKDVNVLGSIEVLDAENKPSANKKGKKQPPKNKIVKEEEVHELRPLRAEDEASQRLTGSNAAPIDYFNITPRKNAYDEGYYPQDNQTSATTNPNAGFFEKTAFATNEIYAGQYPDNNTQGGYSAQPTYSDRNAEAGYNEQPLYQGGSVQSGYNTQTLYQDSNAQTGYNEQPLYQNGNAQNEYDSQSTYPDNDERTEYNLQPSYQETYAESERSVQKVNDAGQDLTPAEDGAKKLSAESVAPEAFADDTAVFDMDEPKRKRSKTKDSTAEMEAERDKVAAMVKPETEKSKEYRLPSTNLLAPSKAGLGRNNAKELADTARLLEMTLDNFGVKAKVTEYTCGPSVTRFELQPEMGVKVSKIVGLADDIKLNLAAADIRIEAPIPGKPAVGIEVPNKEKTPVSFRELIESDTFRKFPSKIPFAVGKDIGGQVIVADIAKMPHLMVAGSTGSGKSVCINSLIVSILYKARPDEVKLIMVDPKKVEFSVYNGIPHLLIPVVTDPKKAAGALNWAVVEMTNRYQLFAQYNVRNLQGYNDKVKAVTGKEEGDDELKKLPQIVIIIDELADLMMVAHGEVEDAIVRLAQLARAAGIHMVIATQRPSADVITGLIKANVPSRIAMKVSNGMESRIILDQTGAEKLLGNGDMMFYPTGYQKPVRVQGAYLSDDEISDIVDFIKNQQEDVVYDASVEAEITGAASAGMSSAGAGEPEVDDYFADAGRFIIGKDKASIGMLQRVYKIGFNRAARIMDQLSDAGVVGPEEGTKPRKVLMSLEEFENYCDEHL